MSAVTFKGTLLLGTNHSTQVDPQTHDRQETSIFGEHGATSLTGQLKPRNIRVVLLVEDPSFTSDTLLGNYIDGTLSGVLQGDVGTLVLSGGRARSYANCELVEVREASPTAQKGPLPNGAAGTWTQYVTLVFRQLR